MDTNNRMRFLIDKLNEASKAYYAGNSQIMPDYEYDKLYDELVALEAESGVSLPDSPTRKIGYEAVDSLEKVRHEIRLLSLDKTKEISKLESFLSDMEGILSWKLDGLTIVLKYSGGSLKQAVTRGNGEIGEDVTHNARVFRNIPRSIPYTGELVVRGEAIIRFSDFEKINAGLDESESYKNPRNLCSGTVRQLNSKIVAERSVMFYAFNMLKSDGVEFNDKKSNQLIWLSGLGFSTTEYKIVTGKDLAVEVNRFKDAVTENDFATDGLVLTYDSISYSESLGQTAKFPKDSIAFKWADEIAETKLIDVVWNTSRTGLINPVAVFEPVELEGTTVNKASLHNLSVFENFKLGAGDIVAVYKANMIIPQLAENLTKSGGLTAPVSCGVCGHPAEAVAQAEGRALYCLNPNCRAQLVNRLAHFASRDGMNIEGLSEETLEKFIGMNFLENYPDIYELGRYEKEITETRGFGKKSFGKLMDSIERSKDAAPENFIYALGIRHVGLSNAKILCGMYGGDIEAIIRATYDELISEKHFGDAIAGSLVEYFGDETNIALMRRALGMIRLKKPAREETAAAKPLKDMTFVITGDLNLFKNRRELQSLIEKNGGKAAGSVSKNTTYLINNNKTSGSSKNKTAAELGVPVIDEEGFMRLLNGEDI